jgi:hypothetical protein
MSPGSVEATDSLLHFLGLRKGPTFRRIHVSKCCETNDVAPLLVTDVRGVVQFCAGLVIAMAKISKFQIGRAATSRGTFALHPYGRVDSIHKICIMCS